MAGALRGGLRLGWAAVSTCVLALLLAAVAPLLGGWRSFTVMSGSMEPVIHTGDVVVEQPILPRQIRIGDVVTFQDPDEPSRMLTHRVRTVRVTATRYDIVTKGDANRGTVERWAIAPGEQLGRVRYHVPRLGYAAVAGRSPTGRIVCLAVPAVVLAGFALLGVWRPRREPRAG